MTVITLLKLSVSESAGLVMMAMGAAKSFWPSPGEQCLEALLFGTICLEEIAQTQELLSKVVFEHLSQAATWFDSVTSIPSLNFTPLMTLPR